MSGPRLNIPLPVRERQRQASDPAASAWVSANAGSGKTHVLTQRVLRLLIAGAAPSGLLCLTFTKTAAANMAARVFETLASWTGLDDAALSEAIAELGAPKPNAQGLAFARRLFARAIETPGGLKIQTIHAFCERLLHVFPFEANVPAGFSVADDREAAALIAEARARAFADDLRAPEREAEVARIAREAGAEGFDALLAETLSRRAEFDAIGDAEAYAAALRRALDLGASETSAAIKAQMLAFAPQWAEWIGILGEGGKTERDLAGRLRGAVAAGDEGSCLAAYLDAFFTKDGKPRGGEKQRLVTDALAKRLPSLPLRLAAERERLIGLRERLRSAEALERSVALYRVAEATIKRYAALKGARGLLDYDDLIARTRALLERADAAWVLYKLDASLEHLLVDEAQDTSPAQWAILAKLSEEFLSGAGARGARTLFAVGDEKQSIFSFQGAAPHMFSAMRRRLARRHEEAKLAFAAVPLSVSFRSAPDVLKGVDAVFAAEPAWRGLTGDDAPPPPHQALRDDLEGVIEVWPPIGATKATEREDWRMPVDETSSAEPPVIAARRIAATVKAWLAPNAVERVFDVSEGKPRRIRPGDVMVLVRSRGAFFEAMIRALKENDIATAGADRLLLRDSLAAMDLAAAGRAALLPEDDLTLATALKSPLIGLDDDDLLAIAPGRAGSLFDALAAASEPRFVAARARLENWRRRARERTPFAFYAALLGADGGRRALLERLGPEASDAIDEVMALALAHEREQAPSLAAFLAELEADDAPVKRDMEARSDGVRVMTVHAAKGLEAPIVFLADACSVGYVHHTERLLDLGDREAGSPLFVWAVRKSEDSAPLAVARARMLAAAAGEHRRLLYVAMTRAAQRLIVVGHHGVNGPAEDNWHALIGAGLGERLQPAPAPWDASEAIMRFGAPPRDDASAEFAPMSAPIVEPDWLRRLATPEAPPATLSPSRAAAPQRRADEGDRGRRQTGVLAHALLQRLPDVLPERRRAAAQSFLSAQSGAIAEAERTQLVGSALAVLALPALAPLFAAGSRAEVAIAGVAPREGAPALPFVGRIDRLAVAADAVYLADYKTGARPSGANPRAYVAQLALYRAALAALYPDRPIRAFLIWLTGAEAVEIAAAELDAALASLAAS
ncbi:MAG: double-strand break repair helicase AddA [Roseiarcus sp.]|jgi:ATP-dependent helicase/nuclease subunit A